MPLPPEIGLEFHVHCPAHCCNMLFCELSARGGSPIGPASGRRCLQNCSCLDVEPSREWTPNYTGRSNAASAARGIARICAVRVYSARLLAQVLRRLLARLFGCLSAHPPSKSAWPLTRAPEAQYCTSIGRRLQVPALFSQVECKTKTLLASATHSSRDVSRGQQSLIS